MAVVLTTLVLLALSGAMVLHARRQLELATAALVAIDADGLRRSSSSLEAATHQLRRELADRPDR